MEFKIKRSELVKGLGLVQSVTERKTTMPILANVLLEMNGNALSITATDLETGINCILQTETSAKGKVIVHSKSLYDIVKELPENSIQFNVEDNNRIEINCGKGQYKIMGLAADDFPLMPVKGQGDIWKMDANTLTSMIEKTSFAMSSDETRFNLNGVYIDPIRTKDTFKLRMVATDGHRLSIIEREIKSKCGINKGVIIPRKGVWELKKLVDDSEGSIDLWVDQKHLIAYSGNVTLYVRLIEGQFPPYDQIVPKQSKRIVSTQRELLAHALKRVSVLSTDRSMGVKFSVSSKNLDITTSNPDLGEAREEIEAIYKGESFDVGFNARYFLDVLNVMEDEQAVLELGDETAPCVLRSEKDRGFTHVIMPMRL